MPTRSAAIRGSPSPSPPRPCYAYLPVCQLLHQASRLCAYLHRGSHRSNCAVFLRYSVITYAQRSASPGHTLPSRLLAKRLGSSSTKRLPRASYARKMAASMEETAEAGLFAPPATSLDSLWSVQPYMRAKMYRAILLSARRAPPWCSSSPTSMAGWIGTESEWRRLPAAYSRMWAGPPHACRNLRVDVLNGCRVG